MTERAWFAPKAVGYGSSWPIAWQGWVVFVGFFVGLGLSLAFLHGLARPVTVTALICAFALICYKTTDGGWRWRP
ncbi:MAG: hypothetical protein KA085_06425 [Phenylobacterium sp.]|jgi:hypothetical protein|uniref:hypothetical protein n=1 Tax=Phenylobacterium sp. TaxID=1871053 RepID=UPI001B4D2380|nr:hypothetical protein [Phenylobacterium sp.]MBP7650314.1 hypothetical protein [Phenylobacterium sp.]MBP7815742.1 hypothetical protein [Phenylobacterium sp.]MBP9755652.1 hypothetical protein [Phenylobacterium sp.]